MAKSKREIILEKLQEGGATVESLAVDADCKYESVMSIFSTLRLMGHFPVKDVPSDDDPEVMTFRLVGADEWANIKSKRAEAAKANKRPARTPIQVLEAARKKVDRCNKVCETAVKRANENEESQLLEWKAEVASLNVKIAGHELASAQIAYDKAPEGERGDEPTEAPEEAESNEEEVE